MDIGVLREFITLSQTLSYTKSAEMLHLTQPTLSKHISTIEKELGCELFNRDRRHVELTDAGNVFAAAALQIIDVFDEAQAKLSEIQMSSPLKASGILYNNTIASITSIAATMLDSEGHVPVVYKNFSDANYTDQLLQEEIDIALIYCDKEKLESLGLSCVPLTRSRFVALVSLENPLSRLKSISIDDLRNYRFIKFADGYAVNGWANIEKVCSNHGFAPRTKTVLGRTTVNYCATPLSSEDVSILEESMPQLRYLSTYARVKAIPLVDDDAEFHLFAIYKNDNYERVKPVLDAYAAARRIIVNHGRDSLLVDKEGRL